MIVTVNEKRTISLNVGRGFAVHLVSLAEALAPYMEPGIEYDCTIEFPGSAEILDIKFLRRNEKSR